MKRIVNSILRFIFFAIVVKIIVLIIIGLNIRRRKKLPTQGPAVIVANHNSHLDTLVLISLFDLKLLNKIRPVAAADYFLKNKFISWFSQNIIGIIPINRKGMEKGKDPLTPCYKALDANNILIIFPEGTRGEPEQLSEFKKGIAYLAAKYPNVPIVPVFMHGLGKALPRNEFIIVPFFCDVFVGEPLYGKEDKQVFMEKLHERFEVLSAEKDPSS